MKSWSCLLAAVVGWLTGAATAAPVTVRADSRIEVVFLTAPDCVYCKSWRHMRAGDWPRFSESESGRQVQLVTAQKPTLREKVQGSHYPEGYARLHALAPQFGNFVPAWWLLVDGVPVTRRAGETRWRQDLEPVVERFARAKLAGGGVVDYTSRARARPAMLAQTPADLSRLPYLGDNGRQAYDRFLQASQPRAFALSPDGSFAWNSGADAAQRALDSCNAYSFDAPCQLYVVDDLVVFKPD